VGRRQRALAAIEVRGTFYDCETTSPAQADIYDDAEMAIARMPAYTTSGVLAKLWLGFSHSGTEFNERDQRINKMIRHADLPRLKIMRADLAFNQDVMLSALDALTTIAQVRS
jgi:hypothetical protein